MLRKSASKKVAIFVSLTLAFQSLAPLSYAGSLFPQQGGGPGGSNPVVTPGTDPWDTLLPDVYTDLPIGHPDEGNTTYDEMRSYMWNPATLATLNAIDYSADSPDPDTWIPSGNNGNSQDRDRWYLPWEGPGGGQLTNGSQLLGFTGGDGLGSDLGGGSGRGQITGQLNTNTGKMDLAVPIVSFSGKSGAGTSTVNLAMVLRPPSLPSFINQTNMWTDNYDIRLDVSEGANTAIMRTAQGTLFPFNRVNGVWQSPFGLRATLVNLMGLGYQLQWKNGDVWFFGFGDPVNVYGKRHVTFMSL